MDRLFLQRFLPDITPDTWLTPLSRAIEDAQLNTPQRFCDFMAQVAHESGGFRGLSENLNYSAQALLNTFPTHFTADQATRYAHKPQLIGARAYANRLGNGSESSGDGYTYRGRGLIQITGRDNYRECSQALLGLPQALLNNPDQLAMPTLAARSAAWFWRVHGCNEFADKGDFEGLTKRINGGLNGLQSRLEWREKAYAAMCVEMPK